MKENDFLRLWLWKLEDSYGVTEAEIEKRRNELSSQFGFMASANDTVWSVLNELVITMKPYPSLRYRSIYLDMANLVQSEGKDPRTYIESANNVQSDLYSSKIQEQAEVEQQLDIPPGDKWWLHTANDELVCPTCKKASSKIMPASEVVNVPLRCTSDWGCRSTALPRVSKP